MDLRDQNRAILHNKGGGCQVQVSCVPAHLHGLMFALGADWEVLQVWAETNPRLILHLLRYGGEIDKDWTRLEYVRPATGATLKLEFVVAKSDADEILSAFAHMPRWVLLSKGSV